MVHASLLPVLKHTETYFIDLSFPNSQMLTPVSLEILASN